MKLNYWNKILLGLLFVTACSNKPAWEYMPDMANSSSLKAQEYNKNLPHHRAMLTPVKGTVPRNYEFYSGEQNLKNPFAPTEEVLLAGQKTFNIYCAVCHGSKGLGDGSVVPPFPKPPSLHSEKVRGWSDGNIFQVITTGQNLMPSYASQIEPEARWAIIHYLRVLQKSQNPTPEDVDAYRK